MSKASLYARALRLIPMLVELMAGGMSDAQIEARLKADRAAIDASFDAAEARIRRPRSER
jgi:hypothetical protein